MYEKPVVLASDNISEGVFLASGSHLSVDYQTSSYTTPTGCNCCVVSNVTLNHLMADDTSNGQKVVYKFDRPILVYDASGDHRSTYNEMGDSIVCTYSKTMVGNSDCSSTQVIPGQIKVFSEDGVVPTLVSVSASEV